MALRCPFAEQRPLGRQTEPLMTGHNLLMLHTMVGSLYSTDRYFHTDGYSGNESHYGIGGRWDADADHGLDGALYQWQDRARQADANVQANPTAISIETGDNAPTRAADIAPWTPNEQATIVRVLVWESSRAAHAGCPSTWTCHQEGIPLVLVPDSKPGRRGVSYHRQGIDPWRVPGGQTWSTVRGKECPGPARIAQIPALIERARSGGQGGLTLSEAQDILDAIARLRQDATVFGTTGFEQTMEDIATRQRDTLAKLDELLARPPVDSGGDIGGPVPVTVQFSDEQLARFAEVAAPLLAPAVADLLAQRLES